MDNRSIVYGVYSTLTAAEEGLDRLKREGFNNADISVLYSSAQNETAGFAHEYNTKLPEGAATGSLSGATLGGILGWLAGIGTLAIPGVGPLIAAGPIMATLAGVGVGGTLGGIAGALVGYGIPEFEAKKYESKINEGGVLISIQCQTEDLAEKAEDILDDTGADDISTQEYDTASGSSNYSTRTPGMNI